MPDRVHWTLVQKSTIFSFFHWISVTYILVKFNFNQVLSLRLRRHIHGPGCHLVPVFRNHGEMHDARRNDKSWMGVGSPHRGSATTFVLSNW